MLSCQAAFRVVRVDSAGELDRGFDGDGTAVVDFADSTSAAPDDVELQPDGRIVVVGAYTDPRWAAGR